MRATFTGAILVVAAAMGCAVEDDSESTQLFRKQGVNGIGLNGASVNGIGLNGIGLNGLSLNGIGLNGIGLNGIGLNGIGLNGSSLYGWQTIDGQQVYLGGSDLIGAELSLTVGAVVFTLTLDDIYLDPASAFDDVYLYEISVHDPRDSSVTPLCQVGGQAVPAIPMHNYWDLATGGRTTDANAFTFACDGGALAKCARWGYRPWATATSCVAQGGCKQVSLADWHQACTRMVRADYCGDGTPHTVDGTPIDMYDRLTPQIQVRSTFNNPKWKLEAEWGPDGAMCVGEALRSHMLGGEIEPECLVELEALPACGQLTPLYYGKVADAICTAWENDPSSC